MLRKVGIRISVLTQLQQYLLQKNSYNLSLLFCASVTNKKQCLVYSLPASLMFLRDRVVTDFMKVLKTSRSCKYLIKTPNSSLCSRQYLPILLKVYCDLRMQFTRLRTMKPWLMMSMMLIFFCSSLLRAGYFLANWQVSKLMIIFFRQKQQIEIMFVCRQSSLLLSTLISMLFSVLFFLGGGYTFISGTMNFSISVAKQSAKSVSMVFLRMAWPAMSVLMRWMMFSCLSFLKQWEMNSSFLVILFLCLGLLMLMLMLLLLVFWMLILMWMFCLSWLSRKWRAARSATALVWGISWVRSILHYQQTLSISLWGEEKSLLNIDTCPINKNIKHFYQNLSKMQAIQMKRRRARFCNNKLFLRSSKEFICDYYNNQDESKLFLFDRSEDCVFKYYSIRDLLSY